MPRSRVWLGRVTLGIALFLGAVNNALALITSDKAFPGYSPDHQGLLAIKQAIPAFDSNLRRGQYLGWSDSRSDDYCRWTGVTCDNGNVVGLQLPQNASWHREVLSAASGLKQLKSLDLTKQAFTGTLPSVSFPTLETLRLADNNIEGMLPSQWGLNGSFPQLMNLTLSFNPGISGNLSDVWGLYNTSFRKLKALELNNCNLTGTLPAVWATQLPALREINVSSNFLTGTLPPQWSALNLEVINLDRNALSGTIPASWGANGTFANLRRLQLFGNVLSGSLPDSWSSISANRPLPSVVVVDVAGNERLGGQIPDGWGKPGRTFIITQGNRFCGRAPLSGYIILSCGLIRKECKKTGVINPNCLAAQNSTASPPVSKLPRISDGQDQAVLTSFSQAFWNWGHVKRTELWGWDSSRGMCDGWHGVTCSPQGHVTDLDLKTLPPRPPVISPLSDGFDDTIVHGSRAPQLQGRAADVLQILSKLPELKMLDLGHQHLSGPLPTNVSFASLTTLRLTNTHITGTIPAEWSRSGSFPKLKEAGLNGNAYLGGTLPASWGSQPNSMGNLELLVAQNCKLKGGLPVSWVSQLPALGGLDITNNDLSGTLPTEWQSMGSMTALTLVGNALQGTLPKQWSSAGPAAWGLLKDVHLDANLLSGTLPDTWGSRGSFSAITNITLASNNLRGSIPASWGSDANGKTGFRQLPVVTLRPGNPGLCGQIPGGLQVVKAAQGQAALTLNSLDKQCPASALAEAGSTTSGNSAPVGAIVGGVVGGCVLLGLAAGAVCAGCTLARRRRQDGHHDQALHMVNYRHSSMDGKVEALGRAHPGAHTSGSPRREDDPAPTSVVPFLHAPASRGLSSGSSNSSGSREGGAAAAQAPAAGVLLTDLPMLGLRDWELNLGALEVELDDNGKEVELGKGAFGVVIKGRYRLMPVAIKRLINQSPEQQRQFLKEMAILRACRGSRYIVTFVGASLQPRNTILAMDFMDGGSLWNLLPRTNKAGQRPFQFQHRGKRIAYEVALGLHFIHGLKVVHLDLKSCNVLIGGDGTAKISDVGLALLIRDRYLSSTAPAGTFSWVAPEVILGGNVSEKADIFSFGVVLWEIITLERPTWRGNLRPVRVPEECPQEVADLIQRCTGDASQRPDAQECAETLAQFVPNIGARRVSSRSLSGSTPPAVLQGLPSARTASGEASPLGSSRRTASRSISGELARPDVIPEGETQPEQLVAEDEQAVDGAQKVEGSEG